MMNKASTEYALSIPRQIRRPIPDLLDHLKGRENIPLYDASISADWQAAKAILKERPELVRFAITESLETPLHVVVSIKESKQTRSFVQKLLQMMAREDLELQDHDDNTALCSAVVAGNLQSAKLMLKKNVSLLCIPTKDEMMPLNLAVIYGKHNMARYLYNMSRRMTAYNWAPSDWADILVQCIHHDMFDVALNIGTDVKQLLEIFKGKKLSHLAVCRSLLEALAQKPEAFMKRKGALVSHLKVSAIDTYNDAMKILRYIYRHILEMKKEDGDIDQILGYKESNFRILFVAAELGNTAFVMELFRGYRDLIWKTNDQNYTIIHIAVLNGHEGIYNLIHEIGGSKKNFILSCVDKDENNMLHLFGLRKRDKMTRRPMQIVQEYQWYKEVEMMLHPLNRNIKNKEGKTPYELFSDNIKEAWSESLMWADYGLVVATLVLGASFAATCSVPGGFDQNKGYPVLTNEPSFVVFALADTIAFLTSIVSVLAFLSIVVFRRRNEKQNVASLATTMLLGLTTLLLSIMAMMVALGASLFILYYKSLKWMIAPMLAIFFIITVIFLFKQFPLFNDMFLNTFHSRHQFYPHVKRHH